MINQNSLPYPTDQPIGQYIQNPVQNGVPFQVPASNVHGGNQQLAHAVTCGMVHTLQENVQKNPLRMFLFNQMSANNYQNPDFTNLVELGIVFSEYMCGINTAMRPEDAVYNACTELCAMISAFNTRQYTGLQACVAPQAWNEINGLISKFERVGEEIKSMQMGNVHANRQPQQSGPGTQQWGGQQTQGWGQPQQPMQSGWGQPQPQQSGYGQFRQSPQSAVGGKSQSMSRWDEKPSSQGSPFMGGGSRWDKPAPKSESMTWGPGADEMTTAPSADVTSPSLNEYFGSKPKVAKDSFIRDWDGFKETDGSEWVPAFKSDWTVTAMVDGEPAFTPAYNSDTHILYHRKYNNIVTEELMEVNDDNQYLANEFNTAFRNGTQQRANSRWDEVGSSMPTEEYRKDRERRIDEVKQGLSEEAPIEEVEETVNEAVAEFNKEVTVMADITAASLGEASLAAYLSLEKSYEDVVEFNYTHTDPYIGLSTTENELGRFQSLATLEDARDYLRLSRESLPEKIWQHVNAGMTDKVNTCIRYQLGIPVSIDSFMEDIEDLIEMITDDYTPAYVEAFRSHTREIIDGSTTILHGDDRRNYLRRLPFKVLDYSDVDNIVIFATNVHVSEIPNSYSDLNIVVPEDTAATVHEKQFPEAYAAIDRIYDRIGKTELSPNEIVICTSDRRKIRVYRGGLYNNVYMVSSC